MVSTNVDVFSLVEKRIYRFFMTFEKPMLILYGTSTGDNVLSFGIQRYKSRLFVVLRPYVRLSFKIRMPGIGIIVYLYSCL